MFRQKMSERKFFSPEDDEQSEKESASIVPLEEGDTIDRRIYRTVKLNPIVVIKFIDGNTIRHLFNFLMSTVKVAPLLFKKNGIEILRGNEGVSVVTQVKFNPLQLLEYTFDPARSNQAVYDDKKNIIENECVHAMSFDLKEFQRIVKNVSKRDGIELAVYEGNPNIIMRNFGSNKNNEVTTTIRSTEYKPSGIKIADSSFSQSLDSPSCKVPLDAFCAVFSGLATMKCNSATINCYPKGVAIGSQTSNQVVSRVGEWGICDTEQRMIHTTTGPELVIRRKTAKTFFSTNIPDTVITPLSKIYNLCPKGIVQIYSECDNMVRFLTCVGSYATLTVYIIEHPDPNVVNKTA